VNSTSSIQAIHWCFCCIVLKNHVIWQIKTWNEDSKGLRSHYKLGKLRCKSQDQIERRKH